MKTSCRDIILASRLIRSAEQLEAVKSAIDDPINTELVLQLESYLDKDAKKMLTDAEKAKEQKAEKVVDDMRDSDSADDVESDPGFGGMGGRGVPERFSGRPSAPMDMDTPDLPGDFVSEDEESTEETADVESSSTVYGKPVTAASDIQQSDVAEKVNSLKGYLNANSSTAGADRVVIKDDELWIHFNDSINLNNMMLPVIEYMTIPYPWLAFNRLARSENAMVFVINFADQFDRDDTKDDAE